MRRGHAMKCNDVCCSPRWIGLLLNIGSNERREGYIQKCDLLRSVGVQMKVSFIHTTHMLRFLPLYSHDHDLRNFDRKSNRALVSWLRSFDGKKKVSSMQMKKSSIIIFKILWKKLVQKFNYTKYYSHPRWFANSFWHGRYSKSSQDKKNQPKDW